MTCKLIQLFKLIRIEPPLRRIISYAGQINGPAFDVEQRQIQGPARRFLSSLGAQPRSTAGTTTSSSQLNGGGGREKAYAPSIKPPAENSENGEEDGAGQPPLQVTEQAIAQLQRIADTGEFLRISVEGGGCSGFNYKMELDRTVDPTGEDVVMELASGATVVVDKLSLKFVRGSKLDFVDSLIRSTFRITNNPVATQGCSCGSSFAPKDLLPQM